MDFDRFCVIMIDLYFVCMCVVFLFIGDFYVGMVYMVLFDKVWV